MRALFHDCQVTTAARADAHKIDEGRAHDDERGRARAMDVMPLLLLVAGSAAIAAAARRTPIPAPLLLVAAGLVISYVPGVPEYTLDPDVVLPIILPPLLHSAATDSSYLDLRAQM
ncbi:MAG: hypothetical protein ACJ75C_10070, partial [Actinomycetes bacterium]